MEKAQLSAIAATNPVYRSHLRLVQPEDAAFIHSLRHDPALNAHLSPPVADVAQQREWIERYKQREAAGAEFYFVIVCDSLNCGVVRLYDLREIDGQRSFSWGSWIITYPRPAGLVTYSAVCMYDIGFQSLGRDHCHFEVRKTNQRVIEFHLRTGARQTGETDDALLFEFTIANYETFRRMSMAQIISHRSPSPVPNPTYGRPF